jgi:hypothetical protein
VQGENRTPKATTPAYTAHDDIGRTATLDESAQLKYAQKQLRMTQRNIYFLGNITYQLLFGRKYEPSDKVVAANIRKLSRRWRKILDKALIEQKQASGYCLDSILAPVSDYWKLFRVRTIS